MSREIKILHAGALRLPIAQCAKLFKNANSGVDVSLEAYGSRACARLIRNGKNADIVALADPVLFDELLIPDYVDRYFIFASDQIVLAYDEFSRGSNLIEGGNWFNILLRDDVNFGRSDENLDPCGYRTLMVWQLAEKYYNKSDLASSLNSKCTADHIYPKSYDLASNVLEGKLDYAFVYLCVAKQFGLKHVILPEKINLANPAYARYYQGATASLQGKNPGETTVIRGAPIEFAIAVLKNAENPERALSFLNLILSKKGQQVLENCGLIPY